MITYDYTGNFPDPPDSPVKHAAKIDFCSEFRGVEGDVALPRSLAE